MSTLLLGLVSCGGELKQNQVVIFAASSLTDSFRSLESAFELANPDIDIVLNFASSSALLAQIRDSRVADLYASADLAHIEALIADELMTRERSYLFARNKLVVAFPVVPDNPLEEISDLASPGVQIVMAFAEVPAGSYAAESIMKMAQVFGENFEDAVFGNVVSREDNVRQVLLKVELGEADAGFVYRTDTIASEAVDVLSVPDEFQPEIVYAIGELEKGTQNASVQSFLDFLLGAEGQQIMQSWGFDSVSSEADWVFEE